MRLEKKKIKMGSRCRNSAARYSNSSSQSLQSRRAKEKPSTEKRWNTHTQRKTARRASRMQLGLNNTWDRPGRKPPDKVGKDSMKAVTMEEGRGERIWAQKSETSKDTSTLLNSTTYLLTSSDDNEKKPGLAAIDKTTVERGGSSFLLVKKIEEDTEKIHWEPPDRQNMR